MNQSIVSLVVVAFVICITSTYTYAYSKNVPHQLNKAKYGSKLQVKKHACEKSVHPPKNGTSIPTFIINLDLPPEQRWVELMKAKKNEVIHTVEVVLDFINLFPFGKLITGFFKNEFGSLDYSMPEPMASELRGGAKAIGIPLGESVLFNIFYELTALCTSIVAEDPSGEIFHARNLDFGMPFGWDFKHSDWKLTEALRSVLINAEFQRGGKTVFKSVQFAGFIGILTGMKPNAFSVTVDTRYSWNSGPWGILKYVLGDRSHYWLTFLTREVFENQTTFEDARDALTYTKLVGPVYFIMAGTNKGQGSVISRDRSGPADVWSLESKNNWYVLETNYDRWRKAPFFDNRRAPAKRCMGEMGQQKLAFDGLYNVLSTKPVLNKQTVYTALLQPKSSRIDAFLRFCPDPCDPI